jgi:hypothetical protein
MQRFFRVSPPAVHQIVVSLEKAALIAHQPGVPRSIALLVDRKVLPEHAAAQNRPINTSVQTH